MPYLNYTTSPDGPILEAVIGVDGASTVDLLQADAPVPLPIRARSLLDRGSDLTAVDPHILQALGAVLLRAASTVTAAGPVPVNLFKMSLSISGPSGAADPCWSGRPWW